VLPSKGHLRHSEGKVLITFLLVYIFRFPIPYLAVIFVRDCWQ